MNTNNNNGQQSSSSYDIEQGKLPVLTDDEKREAEIVQKQLREQQQRNTKEEEYSAPAPPSQAPNYVEPEIVYGTTSPCASATSPFASAPPIASSSIATAPPPSTTAPPQLYTSAPPKIPTATIVGTPIPPATSATVQHPHIAKQSVLESTSPTAKIEIHTRRPFRLGICPYCNAKDTKTTTVTSPNVITCIAMLIILLFFWPLFWIPLCIDRCKCTKHYCSVCNRELDEIEPLSDCCVKQRRR